jgi:methyl acetate hydrolase
VITASKVCLMTPLLFDPGERWDCGTNFDWCGQIVEAITDQRLGYIFKTRMFEPLGIQDMTFEPTDAMRQRLAGIHARGADGSLTPRISNYLPSLRRIWAAMAFTARSATTYALSGCG